MCWIPEQPITVPQIDTSPENFTATHVTNKSVEMSCTSLVEIQSFSGAKNGGLYISNPIHALPHQLHQVWSSLKTRYALYDDPLKISTSFLRAFQVP